MSLTDLISSQLGSQVVSQLSGQLGKDESTTTSAVSAALPMILGALARNTKDEQGATSLAGALERDHDGSILDNLGSLISSPEQSAGSGILRHVLGQKQPVVEQAVAQKSGMDLASTAKLLTTLAPIVMGVLGKQKKEQGLDAGGLAGLLTGEKEKHEQSPNVDTGLISQLLDRDGDGSVMDDIGGMIGGLFGR